MRKRQRKKSLKKLERKYPLYTVFANLGITCADAVKAINAFHQSVIHANQGHRVLINEALDKLEVAHGSD